MPYFIPSFVQEGIEHILNFLILLSFKIKDFKDPYLRIQGYI